ncbi:hypothetical protein [Candidatus Poriferisocius sp.]|uniref:hypothetical protein n=1 Tax=Candidatus Poriferisocius sp. TaxID=3101276 RepID=UPI003B02BFF8
MPATDVPVASRPSIIGSGWGWGQAGSVVSSPSQVRVAGAVVVHSLLASGVPVGQVYLTVAGVVVVHLAPLGVPVVQVYSAGVRLKQRPAAGGS